MCLPNLFPHPSFDSGLKKNTKLFCRSNRRGYYWGQSVKLSSPFCLTWDCLRCFLAEASFLLEKHRGDLWPNMLTGKCEGTRWELSILGICSKRLVVRTYRQWNKKVRDKQKKTVRLETGSEREERAVLCAVEAISLYTTCRRDGGMMGALLHRRSGAEEGL